MLRESHASLEGAETLQHTARQQASPPTAAATRLRRARLIAVTAPPRVRYSDALRRRCGRPGGVRLGHEAGTPVDEPGGDDLGRRGGSGEDERQLAVGVVPRGHRRLREQSGCAGGDPGGEQGRGQPGRADGEVQAPPGRGGPQCRRQHLRRGAAGRCGTAPSASRGQRVPPGGTQRFREDDLDVLGRRPAVSNDRGLPCIRPTGTPWNTPREWRTWLGVTSCSSTLPNGEGPGRRMARCRPGPFDDGQAMPTGLLRQPSFSADGRLAPGTSLGAYIFLSPG